MLNLFCPKPGEPPGSNPGTSTNVRDQTASRAWRDRGDRLYCDALLAQALVGPVMKEDTAGAGRFVLRVGFPSPLIRWPRPGLMPAAS